MSRFITATCLATLIAGTIGPSPADAQIKKATAQPTVANMKPGETVIFDDRKCPAGMIARYKKSEKKEQIGRTCIHI